MEQLCLQNYGVSQMETREMKIFNGGQDPDGCEGCSDGLAVRRFIGAWFRLAKASFSATRGYYF